MVATHRLTIQEFEAMPLEGSWELVDGELVEVSPNAGNSGWISGRLFSRIERFVDAHQLGWAFPPETGFILFNDRATVRSPDGAFIRGDRLAGPSASFVPVAPDLAVEVLSPTDRRSEARAKVTMYLQAGVELVWLVDPANSTITVFRADGSHEVLRIGDSLDGGDVLPGFSIPVSDLFPSRG